MAYKTIVYRYTSHGTYKTMVQSIDTLQFYIMVYKTIVYRYTSHGI